MDSSSAILFNYSKASGLLGKAFIGKRTGLLFEKKSLSELWTLLFKSQSPVVSERFLAQQIELEAQKRFINQYIGFLRKWDNPPEILVDQLKLVQLRNIKLIYSALSKKEEELPYIVDLAEFSSLDVSAWPNLELITKNSEFSWCREVADIHNQRKIEYKMDLQFLQSWWNQIQKYHGEEKSVQRKFFIEEFSLKNIIWALRLSVYYDYPKDEIIKNLLYVTERADLKDPVAAPVFEILDKRIDKWSDWEKWKYAGYLNQPQKDGSWKIDPVWFEKQYSIVKERHALRIFHEQSMSNAAFVAWFKIKSFELNCIRRAVESIRLGVANEIS
ncbi:MAG: V-type ATPase subunit [Treponema sp.]|nr:V-type ATPase subunit [Treponema sp.]